MNIENFKDIEPTIEKIAYGEETGIEPQVFNGVEHIPYVAKMSNDKIHVYFAPGGISKIDRSTEMLEQRALTKIDPRITYRENGDHATFHGIFTKPEYRKGSFSRPAFDWLIKHCLETGHPLRDTTSINKPIIALFLQEYGQIYDFQPDNDDAIAEIIPTDNKEEPVKIRWLYNILPIEDRINQVREYKFYEVDGRNDIIFEKQDMLNAKHHVVTMHTTYSRKSTLDV